MMTFLALLLSISFSFAASNFNLDEVKVTCAQSITCTQRTLRFKNLIGGYRSLVHLKDTLRVMASDGGYQSFRYHLNKIEGKYILDISFNMKPTISEVNIGFTDRNIEYDPSLLVNLREGDFFETQKLKESIDGLKPRLEALGFPKSSHSFEVIEKEDQVNVNIVVTLGQPRIFKHIRSNAKSSYVKAYLKKNFLNLYNKPFDLNKFRSYLDDAQKELFTFGYYLINLDFTPIIKGNRVILDIKVSNDQLFAFDFKNLQREHRDVLHALVIDLFRKYKRPLSETTLKSSIRDHYQNKALLNAQFRVEQSEFVNMYKEKVQLYRIFLDEKYKTRLIDISFLGNSYFTKQRLKRMFNKEAFELASINYYDEEYFSYFQEYLKSQYIQRGFVQARVADPLKIMDSEKKVASVEYNIIEGQRAFIRKIEFDGLPSEFEDRILGQISNKVGNPFNPIKMAEDIKRVANTLQEVGYYYAEVSNANESDLVKYSKTGSDVDIKFNIETGPVVKLNRILYLGNDKTRKKVILKKISIEQGDLITPSLTRDIEASLSATGLFNSVTVSPLRHNSKNAATDLLVKVSEREYGLVELAPGYRTDLGIKLTGTVTYQNLGGHNRSITLRSQLNQRLSYRTLDPERRDDAKQLLEHNTSLTHNQGDIFDTKIDGAAGLAYQTRRFYAFDANIYRANATLTRDITKRLSSSIRYQYEDIKQFNATQAIDNGAFQIGAITPSLTYDLRNSQVNPLKGAFFNLSTEFANPYFLSQQEKDLTINYYKFISRNRFYIPFKYGTVAISLVGGLQENLAKSKQTVNGVEQTEGYIPNIKVFRLTGMDIVRGFTDEEMNKLPNGGDISDERIANKAYLANFKLEPRYFINDSLMAGVFYDAGRVFVDTVDFGELRDSVGVTFKIITPVGTLDFDYGIKLLRKKSLNGSLEDPGRFHVSIGFF
jgi:outer membrane protein insertion porin family